MDVSESTHEAQVGVNVAVWAWLTPLRIPILLLQLIYSSGCMNTSEIFRRDR